MLVNMFLIPLTLTDSIKAFLAALDEQTPREWPTFLGAKLLTSYDYFVTYFIQLTFLSVGFWLLDLPHLIVRSISKCFHDLG